MNIAEKSVLAAENNTVIAENDVKIYDAAYKKHRDDFWKNLISTAGGRYKLAFAGYGWNNFTFRPTRSFHITSGLQTFQESKISMDIDDYCKKNNISITFNTDNMYYCFFGSFITGLPHIYAARCTDLRCAFSASYLKKLSLELSDNNIIAYQDSMFLNASALKDLTITKGKFYKSLSLTSSPLTADSVKSVINALADHTGTSYERKYTISFKASSFNALEAQCQSPGGGTWAEYVDDKKWNLVLK